MPPKHARSHVRFDLVGWNDTMPPTTLHFHVWTLDDRRVFQNEIEAFVREECARWAPENRYDRIVDIKVIASNPASTRTTLLYPEPDPEPDFDEDNRRMRLLEEVRAAYANMFVIVDAYVRALDTVPSAARDIVPVATLRAALNDLILERFPMFDEIVGTATGGHRWRDATEALCLMNRHGRMAVAAYWFRRGLRAYNEAHLWNGTSDNTVTVGLIEEWRRLVTEVTAHLQTTVGDAQAHRALCEWRAAVFGGDGSQPMSPAPFSCYTGY